VPFSALYALGAAAGIPESLAAQPGYFLALNAIEPVMSPDVTLQAVRPEFMKSGPVLLGAWILGASWLALRWFNGWRSVRRLSSATRPAADAAPDVHVVDADIEPSVARVFRPIVLLPASLPEKLSAAQLAAVLEHEREHIERRDNLKANLHRLVETLFWFHPLVWFIGRRLVDERERACDEAVLARGHDAGEYVGGILAVCRHCKAHAPHAMAAVAGDLTARVRHILGSHHPVSLGFIKAFALTSGSFLLAAVPLVAGALDGTAHRHEVIAANSHVLLNAEFLVSEVAAHETSMRIDVSGRQLSIHNSSLRELIALAYDFDGRQVKDRDPWLDSPRYDIRAALPKQLLETEDFDPAALRPLVNRLVAEKFNLEIHVNQQCQDPCGPRGLVATR
jgi:hypothetical protein